MYVKNGASAPKENNPNLSCKRSATKKGTNLGVNIGDQMKCPQCESVGRVVWVSQDKKTMGVRCPTSHRELVRPQFKYGARVRPSTKTRKNVVFLVAIG